MAGLFFWRKKRSSEAEALPQEELSSYESSADTLAETTTGVDELEVDLLLSAAGGLGKEGLAEGDDALAGAGDAALDHQELVLDDTVLDEATHGGDVLGGKIVLGGSGVGGLARSVHSSGLMEYWIEASVEPA